MAAWWKVMAMPSYASHDPLRGCGVLLTACACVLAVVVARAVLR